MPVLTLELILGIIDKVLAIHLKNLEVIPVEQQVEAWRLFYRGLNVWLGMAEKLANAMLAVTIAAVPHPPAPPPLAPTQ